MRTFGFLLSLVLALCFTAPAFAKVKPPSRARKAPANTVEEAEETEDADAAAKAAFDAAGKPPRGEAEAEASAGAEGAVVPAAGAGDAGDPDADAAAVANMLALSSGQAPVPTGPPAALAKKLVPVLVAMNLKMQVKPPLRMVELQYFGAADVDGDGTSELIVTWARGNDQGGVALARKVETEHKVVALADLHEPVLRVQAIPLAGNKSRHLLVRSGVNHPGGGTDRRMAVWGAGSGGLRKIWEHLDVDRIEGNTDLSKDREATLSDITFKDGAAGKPGTLTVAVTEYRAPRGKGPEATETRGARTLHYGFDRKRGVLVLRSETEATKEQLAKDELGAQGPGAPGVVPAEAPQPDGDADAGSRSARLRAVDDVPVNQREGFDGQEVINATGLAARENMSRIDLPASPAERMRRRDVAMKQRGEKNKARIKAREEALQKHEQEQKAKDEGESEETEAESTGQESGPRPEGVEAVDSAK